MKKVQHCDIIVIGAGISGLAAANFLIRKKRDVLVLEARNRIGGRIFTNRKFGGVPVDLGGSALHNVLHNSLIDIFSSHIEQFAVNSIFTHPQDYAVYDSMYKRISSFKVKKITKYMEKFFRLLDTKSNFCYVDKLLESFEDDLLTNQEIIEVKQWLKYYLPCWSGAELSETSIRLWSSLSDNSGDAIVKNGYDVLLKQLAQQVSVYLNHPVLKIDYQESPIKIICRSKTFYCNKVIITLPVGVLKEGSCQFYPNLPKEKQTAIQNIGSGLLNKIIMKFPICFWEKYVVSLRLLKGGTNPMPLCINYQAIMGVPILVSLYGGDIAYLLESMSKKELFKFAVDSLKKIYGSKFVEPSKVITTSWQKDVYSKGAYSYLPYGVSCQWFDILARPLENKIFFAGEATSNKDYATVHGAYDTGIRAAKQIERIAI